MIYKSKLQLATHEINSKVYFPFLSIYLSIYLSQAQVKISVKIAW